MPPKFRVGDMFKDSKGVVLATANSFITSTNKLAMGRGAALGMKKHYPNCDRIFGERILKTCGHLGFYGTMIHSYTSIKGPILIGIFQTKTDFKFRSTIELIQLSCERLSYFLKLFPSFEFNLNYPGINFGKLNENQVEPILQKLPQTVTIWKNEGVNDE